jgi:hypothetical protein
MLERSGLSKGANPSTAEHRVCTEPDGIRTRILRMANTHVLPFTPRTPAV